VVAFQEDKAVFVVSPSAFENVLPVDADPLLRSCYFKHTGLKQFRFFDFESPLGELLTHRLAGMNATVGSLFILMLKDTL
jgi:hypothetical protein